MNTTSEQRYLELLHLIRHAGEQRPDRTGTGTRSVFGPQLKFDLRYGFPLLTTKKMFWKGIVGENLWFLRGDTNIKFLTDNGIHVWDEWADANGDLGPVYGKQLRRGVRLIDREVNGQVQTYDAPFDPLMEVIDGIRKDPMGRRHLLSLWNAAELPEMRLPPCHGIAVQFYVSTDGTLHCHMYQRSADMFLGVPFNIAGYALLTHMIAHVCKLKAGTLTVSFGDAHVYLNHFAQVDEQLFRKPLNPPVLVLNPEVDDIDKFGFADIKLEGYESYPPISAPVAV